MTQDNGKTPNRDPNVPLFVVNTLLFTVCWAELLFSAYRHWSAIPKDMTWFVLAFPAPWIVMFGQRRNTGALIVGAFAYGLLADAVRIMHLW